MAAKSYSLDFRGYWREPKWDDLPKKSGIYCVYACTREGKKRVSLKSLLYIGESGNMWKRLPEDPKKRRDKWAKELKKGEVLCVSYAEVDAGDRKRVEAALIYQHGPPCNCEHVYSFPFDKTTVSISGYNAKLSTKFIVERDD